MFVFFGRRKLFTATQRRVAGGGLHLISHGHSQTQASTLDVSQKQFPFFSLIISGQLMIPTVQLLHIFSQNRLCVAMKFSVLCSLFLFLSVVFYLILWFVS